MLDMTPVLIAKSDQINGPDLIGGPRNVKIAGVRLTGKDQATEIIIENDDKLWRPCKTVVRLLARAWGNDGNQWIGKSAQLFYDADVRYGKEKPGGVRVSHLSHLNGELTVCLQVRKGVVKEYTIKPLQQRANTPAASLPDAAADAPQPDAAATWTDKLIDAINQTTDRAELMALDAKAKAKLTNRADLLALVETAVAFRNGVFDAAPDAGDGYDPTAD